MATSKGIHRSTANSKAGRQMICIGKEIPNTLTKEQRDWNAAVEAKRIAKKAKNGIVSK